MFTCAVFKFFVSFAFFALAGDIVFKIPYFSYFPYITYLSFSISIYSLETLYSQFFLHCLSPRCFLLFSNSPLIPVYIPYFNYPLFIFSQFPIFSKFFLDFLYTLFFIRTKFIRMSKLELPHKTKNICKLS